MKNNKIGNINEIRVLYKEKTKSNNKGSKKKKNRKKETKRKNVSRIKFKNHNHLLSKLTSFVWRIENLIEKHRKVECKTKANWVRRLHLAFGDVKRLLVGLLRFFNHTYKICFSIIKIHSFIHLLLDNVNDFD